MTAFLKNSFVIIQITRFQQVIAVYTLQAPNEASKVAMGTEREDFRI